MCCKRGDIDSGLSATWPCWVVPEVEVRLVRREAEVV